MSNLGRPPVVTILGHVDHGKTSLLDRIRSANVASKELGGITQAIGAYQIKYNDQTLTFIDTPGHAAFSAMRARGGRVADIAILLVAADDGVMPQTRESIEHIRSAKVPYIVAINKVDLPTANVTKVKTGLAEVGEYVEGFGGNVPVAEISAKTGQGVNDLLETILLLAEVEGLKDTSKEPASALVVESQLNPQKGPLATLLVKTGVFQNKGDLYVGTEKIGKIRSLINSAGQIISEAPPSTPVQILGFTKVPSVGDIITTVSTKAESKTEITNPIVSAEEATVKIILKADVAGSLEAILGSLPEKVFVLSSSVGGVTESDVRLAATNQCLIICFNSKATGTVAKLAQVEGVKVLTFGIVYELFDYLADLVEKGVQAAAPVVIGEAKVVKLFDYQGQTIYGCIVTSGKMRQGDEINGALITSLRIGRETVKEVKKDQEFGMVLDKPLDFKPGEVIMSHSLKTD